MSDVVLDASAVLAVLNNETGAESVSDHLPGAYVSAVNAAEVAGKLVDGGVAPDRAVELVGGLGMRVAAFELNDVELVAQIRAISRSSGLSLGDRACLALAQRLGLPALTADRAWRELDVGTEIRLIRGS